MTAVTITQITPAELETLIKNAVNNSLTEHAILEKPTATKKHFTKREAAKELSCSIPMIDKLIQQGRLDKVKVGAKVLIPKEGIDKILSNKKSLTNGK